MMMTSLRLLCSSAFLFPLLVDCWISSLRTTDFSSSSYSNFHQIQAAQRGKILPLLAKLKKKENEESPSDLNNGKIVELNGIHRIFVLSDIHSDHKDNQKWLHEKVEEKDFNEKDLLIIAGDISHNMEALKKSLSVLRQKSSQVLFVPGNHEAWVDRRHKPNSTSFDKLSQVYQACFDMGVHTKSLLVRGDDSDCLHPLWIVPLESWYDGSLSFREELCRDFEHWPWVDFVRCHWTSDFPPGPIGTPEGRIPTGLTDYFLKQNEPILANNPYPSMFTPDGPDPLTAGIMTVSHFLPNLQSLQDWKDLKASEFDDAWFDHGADGMSAKFAKVAGSSKLDDQIRTLLPSAPDDKRRLIHVFGHSHRPKDFEFKGIRYIHNPLGKPRERAMYMVSPNVDFQLVWDTSTGEVEGEKVIRLWEEQGGGLAALDKRLKTLRPKGRYNKHKGSAFNRQTNVTAIITTQ